MIKPTQRPIIHHLIILGYAIAPIINVLLFKFGTGVSIPVLFKNFFILFGVVGGILILTEPFIAGILYIRHKFSFYLFIVHSIVLVFDNIAKAVQGKTFYHFTLFGATILLFSVILFIFRDDFRIPYFSSDDRFWRKSGKRVRLSVQGKVNNEEAEIIDVSKSGCSIRLNDIQNYKNGDNIFINDIDFRPETISITSKIFNSIKKGKIIRIDHKNKIIGIQFTADIE